MTSPRLTKDIEAPLLRTSGSSVPNPAAGQPGPFRVQFGAVHGAASYEIYTNSNPRPGMAPTIGLLDGDRLVGTATQPAVVDSQAPVKAATDTSFKAGELVNLKVRAVRPEQLRGHAYSPFTAPFTTILARTAAPAAPANLRLNGAATAATVPVQWDAVPSSPAVAEYRLYESGAFKTAVKAPATSAAVGGYTANSPYKITVKAVNTEGESGPSTKLKGTTAPAAR